MIVVLRLPQELVEEDKYVAIEVSSKLKPRKAVEAAKDDVMDEYGVDDPSQFEFACLVLNDGTVLTQSDL